MTLLLLLPSMFSLPLLLYSYYLHLYFHSSLSLLTMSSYCFMLLFDFMYSYMILYGFIPNFTLLHYMYYPHLMHFHPTSYFGLSLLLLSLFCLQLMFSLHTLYYSFLTLLIHLVLSYTFMLLNCYLLSLLLIHSLLYMLAFHLLLSHFILLMLLYMSMMAHFIHTSYSYLPPSLLPLSFLSLLSLINNLLLCD